MVAAHPALLRQVFGNLLTNAVKYVAPGVPPRVSVDATTTAQGWTFTVSDNGIGIPPAARSRVFGCSTGSPAPATRARVSA